MKVPSCSVLLFGGTFDPPHLGHLQAIQYVLENVEIEKVYIVPSYDPPHKKELKVSPYDVRLSLTELLFSELQKEMRTKVSVSDIESKLEKPSYTYRTLEALLKQEANDDICMLVGQDMYNALDTWQKPETLRNLCRFIVLNRPVNAEGSLKTTAQQSKDIFLQNPDWPSASKDLRNMLSQYQSEALSLNTDNNKETLRADILKLIPESIFMYIIENQLYNN